MGRRAGGRRFAGPTALVASNEEAATRLREIFLAQVLPAISRAGPPETAAVRAGLVATQILGFALARYVLRLPPVVAMPIDMIIRTIGDTVQRYAPMT